MCVKAGHSMYSCIICNQIGTLNENKCLLHVYLCNKSKDYLILVSIYSTLFISLLLIEDERLIEAKRVILILRKAVGSEDIYGKMT